MHTATQDTSRSTNRVLWEVSGTASISYLQGLVTNDVSPLEHQRGIVWAAFLSPQGKYLADFFMIRTEVGGPLLIDIAASLAQATLARLLMYRLRADVQITPSDMNVTRGLGPAAPSAFADPRHPALGWRSYSVAEQDPQCGIDWNAIRVAQCIPESGIELIANETYILEAGFERLNGVDFRKGCYVGQEVTARMKHKTELRKGLTTLKIDGAADIGAEIISDGKPVGTLYTQSNGRAIAYVRFDRVKGALMAQDAQLKADSVT